MDDEKLEHFKKDLLNKNLSDEDIVGKYLLTGVPVELGDDLYYQLRKEVGNHFGVSITKIHVVGSSKLGFSIAPQKRFRPINDESDIDVAVIDEQLFDDYWKKLFEFNKYIMPRSNKDDESFDRFVEYFFRGWLRPDLFPFRYEGRREWFDFFKNISYKYKNRKVACAIYKNEYFFEDYHLKNIKTLRSELQNGKYYN